ncbi:MAG: hypothetical protein FWE16_01310 [Firmicutes bacterium]|nr:hypothetical protein [Bacillota bacterium]
MKKIFIISSIGLLLLGVVGYFIFALVDWTNRASPDDFELVISVREITLPYGDNFYIDVRIKNRSEWGIRIAHFSSPVRTYDIGGWGNFPTGYISENPTFTVIQGNSYWHKVRTFRNDDFNFEAMQPGIYELRFNTNFYINWRPRGVRYLFTWWRNEQRINIQSDTIQLTVL